MHDGPNGFSDEAVLCGGNGNDRLKGDQESDRLFGGHGNDKLTGGKATDTLTGGSGQDSFIFEQVSDASATQTAAAELITDFEKGLDLIDLHLIDANGAQTGDAAFQFTGTGAFTATGQVRATLLSTGETLVQVNADTNLATAEMTIVVDGLASGISLSATDFVL